MKKDKAESMRMLSHAPSHLWVGQLERLDYAMSRTRPFIIGYNPERCICFDTPFDYRGLPVSRLRSSSVIKRTRARERQFPLE